LALTNFRVKVGDRWYSVQVGDLGQSPVEVTVDGETLYVEVEGLPQPTPPATRRGRRPDIATPAPRPRSRAASPADNIIRSPMPGKVIAILVRPGDQVSAGAEICVVEAMKMEQSIRAFRDGVVKAVHVQPMDSVRANDPLIELE
jgi:biotin carboxyl carrier protein